MHDPLKSIDIRLRQSYTGHVSAKGLKNSHCSDGLVHITYHEANFPRHNLLTPSTKSEMQLINILLKISDCRGWPGIHLKVCVTTWWDRSNEINFKWDQNTSTGIWCQSWTQRMSQLPNVQPQNGRRGRSNLTQRYADSVQWTQRTHDQHTWWSPVYREGGNSSYWPASKSILQDNQNTFIRLIGAVKHSEQCPQLDQLVVHFWTSAFKDQLKPKT